MPLIKAIGKVVCVMWEVDQGWWAVFFLSFYFEGVDAQVHVVKTDSSG